MEDLWVVVCCIETIKGKEETSSEDNPAPHDESVHKCCATVCTHHSKGDEWNQVFLPQ
jgi:hypothetical protein